MVPYIQSARDEHSEEGMHALLVNEAGRQLGSAHQQ